MGLLDLIRPNDGEDRGQWRDVPIGFRLGLLGNILSSAAQGQVAPVAGFAAMQEMTKNKIDERKSVKEKAKQMELAARYLEKRPDLKPLVEAGAIDISDIIKMEREDKKTEDDRLYNREDWLYKQQFEAQQAEAKAAADAAAALEAEKRKQAAEIELFKQKEQWKLDNDPNKGWWEQFSGGGGTAPAPGAGPNNAPVPGSTPLSPAVPVPPAPPAPGPTPDPAVEANAQEIDPVTQQMRRSLGDPNLTPQEAQFISQTVRNPDDLAKVYAEVIKNRTEMRKAQAEEEKVRMAKEEAAKKEVDAKAASDSSRMVAIAQIDKTLNAMDSAKLPTAGALGYMLSGVGGTAAFEAGTAIETLKSYISLDKLTQMRQNSTSGASGLGQVTNYEQRMLAAAEGSINQGLDEDTLRTNLKEVRARIIAFNTPSREDPSKSQLTVDSEKVANNPTPQVIEAFEAKYGVGSSSVITGDTTPAGERAGPPSDIDDPDIDDILNQYPQTGGN